MKTYSFLEQIVFCYYKGLLQDIECVSIFLFFVGMGVCSSSNDVVKGKPNTALLSTILTLGTFFLAYFLRKFRQGRFLGRSVSIQSFHRTVSLFFFIRVLFSPLYPLVLISFFFKVYCCKIGLLF